jgi:hypothetical protein
MRSLSLFIVIALASATPISARSHHQAAKSPQASTTEAPTVAKPANVPEQNRDPEDIALDRKIKGICRGC